MRTQFKFNIQVEIVSLILTNPPAKMPTPFVAMECPWNERFKSLEPPSVVNRGEFVWSTSAQFGRACPDPGHLNKDYLFVYFYTNPNGIKVTGATLVGSIAADLVSLCAGPATHQYPLQHSTFEGIVKLRVNAQEISPCLISLSSFSVSNLECEESVFAEVSSEKNTSNKLKFEIENTEEDPKHYSNQLPIPSFEVPLTYDQILSNTTLLVKIFSQSISKKPGVNGQSASSSQNLSATLVGSPGVNTSFNSSHESSPAAPPQPSAFRRTLTALSGTLRASSIGDTLRRTLHIAGPINEIGQFEFNLHDLYEYSNPSISREETVYYNGVPISVSYTISVKHFPRYVQSIRGDHINTGIRDIYKDTFYPSGTIPIEELMEQRDPFQICGPACNPAHQLLDTIEPVEYRLKFSNVSCQSSRELSSLSLIMYSVHCFNSKMIALNPFSNNQFRLPSSYNDTLEYSWSTKYLFELQNRFLNVECWNNSRTIYYGNWTISLHNLFSGPGAYEFHLKNGDDSDVDITVKFEFDVETQSVYFIDFDNITITNGKKLGLKFKLDKQQQVISGITSPDDPNNLVFSKTTPFRFVVVTPCNTPHAIKNKLVIEIMNVDVFHKQAISNITIELNQEKVLHSQENIVAEYTKENALSCVMSIYSNTDHQGLYSDYILNGDNSTVFACIQYPYLWDNRVMQISNSMIQSMVRNNMNMNQNKVIVLYSTIPLPYDTILTIQLNSIILSQTNIQTCEAEQLLEIYYEGLSIYKNVSDNVIELVNNQYLIVMYIPDCTSIYKYISAMIAAGGNIEMYQEQPQQQQPQQQPIQSQSQQSSPSRQALSSQGSIEEGVEEVPLPPPVPLPESGLNLPESDANNNNNNNNINAVETSNDNIQKPEEEPSTTNINATTNDNNNNNPTTVGSESPEPVAIPSKPPTLPADGEINKPTLSVVSSAIPPEINEFRKSIKHSLELNIADNIPPAYCRCECGTYLSLVCKNCNKSISTLQISHSYKIECNKCNKETNIFSSNKKDFRGNCKNCDNDLSEMEIDVDKLGASSNTCIQCTSCDKYMVFHCPKCKKVPKKKIIYYKVECPECHVFSLVGKRGKSCNKCQTPYPDFLTITIV